MTQSTPNDGNHAFTLPFSLVPENDHTTRVTDKSNAAVTDDSDSLTIRAPAIAVTYTNGGETLVAEAKVYILWTVDMVLL
jgi:hypothetical protein